MSQRIIAIDDSDIAQEFIRATLADIGFEDVTGYLDPHEALDAIRVGDAVADLILLDIMMPEMDGIELCARIRGIDAWSDVPIIMLTSRKNVDSLSQAFMAGANDYVTKPFDRIELQARMRSCLRLKSELDRRRASEQRQARGPEIRVDTTLGLSVGNLAGTRAGFNASLLSLDTAAQAGLGLVALKIDDVPGWKTAPPDRRGDIIGKVSTVLGQVPIRAREQFAHWEDDLFCFASVGASPAELERTARSFMDAVKAASISVTEGWVLQPISISAGIVAANGNAVAANLAAAVRAVEQAASSGRGAEVLSISSDPSQTGH